MNKRLLISLVVVVIVGAGLWRFASHSQPSNSPTPTVTASPSPSPSSSTSPTALKSVITITSPKAGAILISPITVTGTARVFENQFSAAVTDMTGHIIVKKDAVMSDVKDAGQLGNYSVTLDVPPTAPADIKIIVFALSPKGDGSYEAYAEVAVHLKGLLIQVK